MSKKPSIFKKNENEDEKYMPSFLDPENFVKQLETCLDKSNNKRVSSKDDQLKEKPAIKKQKTR